MKKYIILSLFTVSSACIYTMENKSFFFDSFSIALCFSSFFGWFSSPKESLLISNLRKDVNNFKKKHLDEYEDVYLFGYPNDCIVSHASEGRLVKCCYFYKYKKKELKNLNDLSLNKNQTILNKCLNENIKGYSALGAAIIARDTSFEKRRILVKTLIKLGFKPTEKDTVIAQLYLYDNIPVENQKIFRHLIHQSPTAYWIILPKDVRLSIMRYIIQMFKNEFWLLPGFNS